MSKQIRLSDREVQAIQKIFLRYFGGEDHIWLFGSRTDLSKRGGDIDLYIETKIDDLSEISDKKIKFLVDLKSEIGDQKIDIVLRRLLSHDNLPIYDEARNSGVMLI
ncbi:MAG: nucleotidyltransferase domain-containing protein [Gammaproteobacteria bacterium]